MKITSHLFSLSRNADSLLAACLGFLLIQVFAKHSGVGVSPDSVTYLAATRHLIEGSGFRSFDFLPVVDFPFGYPFFLTAISFCTGLDPLQFGAVLNGILFAALLYLCGGIMNGFQKSSGWYKRIVLLCIVCSPALQEVYSMLWSETVFLLLILWFIIAMSCYLERPDTSRLLISVLVCAMVCITRYAGIFLWLSGCLIIFSNRELHWRKRAIHVFIFASLSVLPLLVNILRNLFQMGLATGIRPKNEMPLLKILELFGGVICDWLLLDRSPERSVMMALLVLAVFMLSLVFAKPRKKGAGLEFVLCLSGLVYCGFMLFTYSVTRYEPFTSRLLSPLYLPLLWTLTSPIPGFLSRTSYRLKATAGFLLLLAGAWFVNVQAAADWEFYDGVKDAGIPGYREDPFTQSEIVKYLKENKAGFPSGTAVYSNAGDAVYFVTGLPALQLPFLDFPDQVDRYYTGYGQTHPEWLVWFQNEENPQMPALDTVLRHKDLILVKQFADGAIYKTARP